MALFKQLRGTRSSLDLQPLTDGYAYFCVDDGTFHIDFKDENGVLKRKQINAKDAETLGAHTADEFLLEGDIDTILAPVTEQLNNKVDTTRTINNKSLSQDVALSAQDVGALPLSGGTMTGEIKIGQGDGNGIQLGTNGRINATVGTTTTATMFGVSNGNYYLGHSGFKTLMRGSTTRPTYNGKDLALYSDISTATNDALASAKESGEFDGEDGYTPVRGTDYWTAADKAEIKSYVDDAILNGAW